MFEKIDSKEKAYIVGFIIGDGHITKNNHVIEVVVKLDDKEITEFISEKTGGKYTESTKFDRKKRIFPKSCCKIYSKKERENLIALYGGRTCKERRVPILSRDLDKYFVLGLFDAEGCITWGKRKDRDRLWQKISFTTDLYILEGLQKILVKEDISTVIRPKANEDCYVMEFSNELDMYKFYKYLPYDLFFLQRKKVNFESWLKETILKYEIKEGDIVNFVDKRTAEKYNIQGLLYLPTKKFIVDKRGTINTNSLLLSKKGISNFPLRLELVEISGSIKKDVILREV